MQSSVELRIDEEVLAIVRKSVVCEIFRFIISVVFLLIPFFFFFPLLKLGGFGFVLFILLESFAIFFSAKAFVIWYYSLLIITNQRFIDVDQHGLFKRDIIDLELKDVRERVLDKKGILRKMFDYGTLIIRTNKEQEFDIMFQSASHAKKVNEMIGEVLKNKGLR